MVTPTWAGCAVPGELLYDLERDVWVRFEGGSAVIGMTDVAQTRCGRIVQISWKSPGRSVDRGRPLCVIESAKWVGPVLSPLSGVLVADNRTRFGEDMAIANRDPYGEGWLVRVQPTRADEEVGDLTDGPAAYLQYRRVIEEEGIVCFRCAE